MPVAQASDCRFLLGFASLAQLIPDVVGQCADNESADPVTGDSLQHTSNGLLVWRKADNWTAFTDGFHSWINGPRGLEERLNSQRFEWENNSGSLPVVPDAPALLPGAVLPAHRIVAYYGNPLSPAMGILGEAPSEQMLAQLKQQAQAYAEADPAIPVQPALELVAVVAQGSPGDSGNYRLLTPVDQIEQVAQWAEQNGFLLILDIQPGHGSIGSAMQLLMPFLSRPYVHLALDPEFDMVADGGVPGQVFGSMDASAVNGVIQTLAQLVSADRLPPKVLIVHRFLDQMLTDPGQVRPDARVQVVIDMDGFGSPANKISKYQLYVHDEGVEFAGIKLFYTQDAPLLSPRQVLALDPSPNVVIYQ